MTGGAGFVGSHLCDALLSEGHEVYCLDNFYTGHVDNLSAASTTGRLTILEHDVEEPIPFDLPRFDQIYNLACPASPRHYQADPVKTALVCAKGALNVMSRAMADRARVLQASTSEVYGDPEVHPQVETYFGNVNPVGPRSCYDEGKRFAETLISDYARRMGVAARVARIFNTYGPRMQFDDGRVVSNFIVQALKGEPITVYGDGSQTRSFCYVADLVRGLIALMNAGSEMSGPVNLGNPVETTVGDLADQVARLTGSGAPVEFHALPVDDPRRRRPDITRAETGLGWRPVWDLQAGLQETIADFGRRLAPEAPAAVPLRA